MKYKIAVGVAASLALLIILTGFVVAQSSANYDLSWFALASGGGVRQSADYQIEDILGQLAGDFSESDESQVLGGFFGPTSVNLIYLPVIERQ